MQENTINTFKNVNLELKEVSDETSVTLSQEELCSIVANKTNRDISEVNKVINSFVELFLKRLKLN